MSSVNFTLHFANRATKCIDAQCLEQAIKRLKDSNEPFLKCSNSNVRGTMQKK